MLDPPGRDTPVTDSRTGDWHLNRLSTLEILPSHRLLTFDGVGHVALDGAGHGARECHRLLTPEAPRGVASYGLARGITGCERVERADRKT